MRIFIYVDRHLKIPGHLNQLNKDVDDLFLPKVLEMTLLDLVEDNSETSTRRISLHIENNNFLKPILFTDEARFTRKGIFNVFILNGVLYLCFLFNFFLSSFIMVYLPAT